MARRIASDRVEHHIYGRIPKEEADALGGIQRVVMHDCFCVCSNPACGKLLPLSEFGLLTDKNRNEVRNQPRCKACRKE